MMNILKDISKELYKHKYMLATAESCTGGLVAKLITDQAGSSDWFERGFITYSNQAKMELLGVKAETLEQYGAVSLETAREMALGCLSRSHAQYSLSITGIAGPGGGNKGKPVGMVCFGLAKMQKDKIEVIVDTQYFNGDRNTIRELAAEHALDQLYKFL